MSAFELSAQTLLPAGGVAGTLVGRIWAPGKVSGPSVIAVRGDAAYDLTRIVPTMSALLERPDAATVACMADAPRVASIAELAANSVAGRIDEARSHLLAPCDLQVLKAAGVTFVESLLERVIEEQARGDASRADEVRRQVMALVGGSLDTVKPGSDQALQLKRYLVERNLWSQYLEVGIGPYAEIFTKGPVLSAVGAGADIGLHPDSEWNNPEPEGVLAVNSRGIAVGATLGNDVNLRDFEGRSALLLGRSKDNNGSCAIGPFIRLFDARYTIDDVRRCTVDLHIAGDDGYTLRGASSMTRISRDPLDLVAHAMGACHQYPDGMMLFLGTMFAPVQDRGAPGSGFTHQRDDIVTISCRDLGALVNRVRTSDAIPPWTFGIGALIANLAARGLGARS
jgi:fumarylacetoacetate (FAA) hydrolase family protein